MLQSCLTLCDAVDCSQPGSSVRGILQARILEWVAMPSSRGSSPPRDWTCISCISKRILYHWATGEDGWALYLRALSNLYIQSLLFSISQSLSSIPISFSFTFTWLSQVFLLHNNSNFNSIYWVSYFVLMSNLYFHSIIILPSVSLNLKSSFSSHFSCFPILSLSSFTRFLL